MLYQQWFEELTALFQRMLCKAPQAAGWQWEAIYAEGLTPLEAIEDYIMTTL